MASKRAHGTRGRYLRGPDENGQEGKGCRCTSCRKANAVASKRYRLKVAGAVQALMVDAAPVRAHVRVLLDSGLSMTAISRLSGVNSEVLRVLMRGHPTQGRGPSRRILKTNAQSLKSVKPVDRPREGMVPALGTQRRLRGLSRLGWPTPTLERETGLSRQQIRKLMSENPSRRVSVTTAAAVAKACRRIMTADPVAAGADPEQVIRARNRAIAKRWVSVLAWADIDDPDCIPDVGEDPSRLDLIGQDADRLIIGKGFTAKDAAERLGVRVGYLHYARSQARQREAVDA